MRGARILKIDAVFSTGSSTISSSNTSPGRSVEIVDPARGDVRLTLNEVSEKYTGVALELSPNEHFQPKNKTETMKFSTCGVP